MFRRIIYEDWQLIFPIVALIAASVVFLTAGWRAARMKREDSDRMARMPLDN